MSMKQQQQTAGQTAENPETWLPVKTLVPLTLVLITVVPTLVAVGPIILATQPGARLVFVALMPFSFSAVYVLLTGLMSVPFHRAIIRGKFPRDVTHVVYGPRRMYGLLWCAFFYFTPIYYAVLSVPFLRKPALRLFGYRGHPDINLAPDAWIRDLPLLRWDQGAYVANKATIGSNMCLADGSILVDTITLGKKCTIGHLAKVAPGGQFGDGCEIGVGCAIGIRTRIGNQARIGPSCTINHGAQVGDQAEVGTMSYVGVKAQIASGLKLPGGSNIPDGVQLLVPEDIQRQVDAEAASLRAMREKLEEAYRSRLQAEAMNREVLKA